MGTWTPVAKGQGLLWGLGEVTSGVGDENTRGEGVRTLVGYGQVHL